MPVPSRGQTFGTPGGTRTHTKQGLNLLPLPIGLQKLVFLAGKEGIEPPNFAFKVRRLCLFAYFPSVPQDWN